MGNQNDYVIILILEMWGTHVSKCKNHKIKKKQKEMQGKLLELEEY
jgi:hypothetical protein